MKRILVTRPRAQADSFGEGLRAAGFEPIYFPVIEIRPMEDNVALEKAFDQLHHYAWVVFTSVNAVDVIFDVIARRVLFPTKQSPVHQDMTPKVAAIGPKTAEALEMYGLKPDLIPSEFKAEGVLAALGGSSVKGQRFLIPRAKVAREVIPDKLREQMAEVTVATAYENVRPSADLERVKKLLEEKKIAAVTFTSSSTVHNFVEILGQKEYKNLMSGVNVACIGPVTAKTAEEYGMKTDIMPRDYTVPALVEAMVDFYEKWRPL